MNSDSNQPKQIFERAIEFQSAKGRDEYLSQICGDDVALKAQVDGLLVAYEKAGNFLEDPDAALLSPTIIPEGEGTEIGPYKLLQQIGEGGFGVVYMAVQQRPVRRQVALKILKAGMDTKEVMARFEAERQALALMEHSNIARVLDAGETEHGRPFFVMELVKGVTLTEFCDQNKLTTKQRLELFVSICRAVQHAHQKGIIHRDLKPSNVMVTVNDNKPVPKIIDFGVSKAISQQLTERTLFTRYGQMIGTPVYMSPEQAQMTGLDVDTRSDIYSLGILLYELLTGTTPLDTETLRQTAYAEVQRLIVEEEAPKPSVRLSTLGDQQADVALRRDTDPKALQQFVRGDLDWIVMKAIDKERNRRYESASRFAEDIERFLKDDAIEARPPSKLYTMRRFARRNRGAVIAASIVMTTAVLGLVGTSWGLLSARKETRVARTAQQEADQERNAAVLARREANAAKNEADQTAEERQRLLYVADMALASQLWDSPNGDLRRIDELLTKWIPADQSQDDWRDFSWRFLWTQLHQGASITILQTTGATVSADGNLITADEDGIHQWNETGNKSTAKWTGDATNVIFSPNRRWAAVTVDDATRLIEIETGRMAFELPYQLCSFSTGGELVSAWEAGTQTWQVWDLSDAEPEAMEPLVVSDDVKLPTNSKSLQLYDDGQSLLLRGFPYRASVAAFFAGQQQPEFWNHRNSVQSCAWSPNGQVMASGSSSGMVHLRLRTKPLNKLVIATHGKFIGVLLFSPDGTRLAVGGSDGTFDLWDTSALWELSNVDEPDAQSTQDGIDDSLLQRVRPFLLSTTKAHLDAGVQSIVFSPDGSKLATHANGTSKLWDLDTTKGRYEVAGFGEDLLGGRLELDLEDSDRGPTVKRVPPKSNEFVSGTLHEDDRIIGITESQGDFIELASKPAMTPMFLTRGPYRSTVRLTIEDEQLVRREVAMRRIIRVDPRPMRVCFSPDGKTIAIADQQTGTTSLNLATGQTKRYPYVSQSVAISSDNRLLAMDGPVNASADAVVWDLFGDKLHTTVERPASNQAESDYEGGSIAYSSDGRFLAMAKGYPYFYAARQTSLIVWRIQDGKKFSEVAEFQNDRVFSDLAFTPNSQHIIATDHAGRVRVWNTDTWNLDREYSIGSASYSLAISSDGKVLAAGGRDQTVLWDLASGRQLRVLSGPTPWALDFSPDGKTLVSGSNNHNVILWDVATGMQLRTFHAHTDAVKGVAFSPTGNMLATVGTEGVLRLWEAATIEEIDRRPATMKSMSERRASIAPLNGDP